jgi:hypothetical protein
MNSGKIVNAITFMKQTTIHACNEIVRTTEMISITLRGPKDSHVLLLKMERGVYYLFNKG